MTDYGYHYEPDMAQPERNNIMKKDPIVELQVMLDRLESDITNIRMKMRGLHYEQLQQKKFYPERPTANVIRFTGTGTNGKEYQYAALAVDIAYPEGNRTMWFTTGYTCPKYGYTWEGLVDLMRDMKVEHYEVQGYHSRRYL